ncbi:MAG TPA: hypothetical protein VGX69_07210 [Solirubrobacteraceae bacterium]|jgi:hypothetical protein|nr:hypothetical protein [Solirubrobacteraceae bacterium]
MLVAQAIALAASIVTADPRALLSEKVTIPNDERGRRAQLANSVSPIHTQARRRRKQSLTIALSYETVQAQFGSGPCPKPLLERSPRSRSQL